MKRILLASSVVWAAGCAAAARTAPPQRAVAVEVEARARRESELEAENERRADRIRQLEAQLALSRAEVAELREDAPLARTVRIGGDEGSSDPYGAGAPGDALPPLEGIALATEEDEEPRGPRPLLRLYGSPAVSIESVAPGGESLPLPTPMPSTRAPAIPAVPPSATYAAAAAAATGHSSPPPSPSPAVPPHGAAAIARYREALEHLRSRRLAEAAAAFAAFLDAYPAHGYADDARFWRAEALYAMRRYPEALHEFEQVVRERPGGNRVPDALLKIGLCHRRMGDAARARAYFRRVRNEHPDSLAARLASQEDAS